MIKKDEDFCMIGYGQSGAGKTATLVYFDGTKKLPPEDGILTEICNYEEFRNPNFGTPVTQLKVVALNLYVKLEKNK